MATLISPGVDVRVLHEDFLVSGNAATIPLVFIATADEKLQPDGVSPALGTYEYGKLRVVTSRKQAATLYGLPKFYTDVDGNPHHGDARNEYGLDAVFKLLEVNERIYVIRANVNLNDNFDDIKSMWTDKIDDAAVYLNELAAEWLENYNQTNGFLVNDTDYKLTVDASTMKSLLRVALEDVLASYTFSKDAFEVAFLQDHTQAWVGHQDVVFKKGLRGTDIVTFNSNAPAVLTFGGNLVTGTGTEAFTVTLDKTAITTFNSLAAFIADEIGVTDVDVTFVQNRLRIASKVTGVTSAVELTADTALKYIGYFDYFDTPVAGVAPGELDVYNASWTTVTGGYDGLDAIIDEWTTGEEVTDEFTPDEAEGVLIDAAAAFDNTKEFRSLTNLGGFSDAEKRATIVKALQAAINDPYSNARSEALEYNIVGSPGYHETADELLRLAQDMFEEVFVVGETPMNKPANGPNGISEWALTPARATSDSIAYWYSHGITSNIDGANILSTSGTLGMKTLAYNDMVAEEWFAPAGPTRGLLIDLEDIGYVTGTLGGPTTFVTEWLDNGARDELYEFPKSINPITFIPGRGFTVLGQRTTSPVEQSTDRIANSRLVKYIKRRLRKSLYSFLMEPNDDITRRNVKAAVDNFLSTLIGRRGLYDFATICDKTNNDSTAIDNREMYVDVAIKPVNAVEFIYTRILIVRNGANIGTGR
jgi:Phage tail sheath protein FI